MKHSFARYILFWAGGSVSQLGSAMTSFALILWAYGRTNSAMPVSVMAFCSYLPYVAVSLFAGGWIDRHSKKKIMLASDLAAGLCSLGVALLCGGGRLELWHIYLVNGVIGFMNSFQSPAQSIAMGILVPKERLAQASGMDSFSSNLVTVLAPAFASFVFAAGGLAAVIAVDLASFVVNFIVLAGFIRIPEPPCRKKSRRRGGSGAAAGFRFLWGHKSVLYVVATMAVLNFLSRLTYENILAPMILARSEGDSGALGLVNAVLGLGGLLGGALVSLNWPKLGSTQKIYGAAAVSFLLGDLLMGLGRSPAVWCFAALAASVPIPFITAGQRVILYEAVPLRLQGSVFSARNGVQYSAIPAGILLGGWLADQVFEPFMRAGSPLAGLLQRLVGGGPGGGMAVMFLCTGALGAAFSLWAYRRRAIRALRCPGGK